MVMEDYSSKASTSTKGSLRMESSKVKVDLFMRMAKLMQVSFQEERRMAREYLRYLSRILLNHGSHRVKLTQVASRMVCTVGRVNTSMQMDPTMMVTGKMVKRMERVYTTTPIQVQESQSSLKDSSRMIKWLDRIGTRKTVLASRLTNSNRLK